MLAERIKRAVARDCIYRPDDAKAFAQAITRVTRIPATIQPRHDGLAWRVQMFERGHVVANLFEGEPVESAAHRFATGLRFQMIDCGHVWRDAT